MTEIKKEKQTRTPRNYDSIFQGAAKLPLKERVNLCKALTETILKEVTSWEDMARQGQELINGL